MPPHVLLDRNELGVVKLDLDYMLLLQKRTLDKCGQQHVVEIQLHHAKFISIRENMGGHYIDSIFRSLTEAVEVVFGKVEAGRMITEHSQKQWQ
jgi:hypothetical protein